MIRKMGLITRMEFKLTAANRAFIILTILGPFFIVALGAIPGIFTTRAAENRPEFSMGIVNAESRFINLVKPALARAGVRVVSYRGAPEDLEAEVRAGKLDAYLVIPADFPYSRRLEYVSGRSADPRAMGILQAVIGQSVVRVRLENAGLSATEVESLVKLPEFVNKRLGLTMELGETMEKDDFLPVLMTGLALVMLLYFTVLLYGQATGRSVLAEKTSKTVEILLSSVKPLDMLYGKILGKALAALLQYGVWVLMAVAFTAVFGSKIGLGTGMGPSTLGFLVLFFLLALFMYSGIYAALGAASQDDQHLNQLAWPVLAILILPVLLISAIILNPSAPFAVGLSLFPLTAPVVMFLRVVMKAAPDDQILISIGLQILTICVVVFLSARIFRVGIMMPGKRFKLREIVKWIAR
jgi:ABC-2 type transport system permease protein